MGKRLSHIGSTMAAIVALSVASGAHAQTDGSATTPAQGAAVPDAPAGGAAPAAPTAASQALQDRVVALVQSKQCGAAVTEARNGGDENLARQVSDMCGGKQGGSGGSGSSGGGGGKKGRSSRPAS